MSGTWWVDQTELDETQRNIIALPVDDSVFITGPPGSGKTNLLLLRANYLYLAGLHNIVVVTFTRSLREFIANGAENYDFPASKIMTCREWQIDFIKQYGGHVESTDDFKADREAFLVEIKKKVDSLELSNVYDAILLDEAQDYTPDEIRLFSSLTDRFYCVADERQKLYDDEDSLDIIKTVIGEPHELQFHYRNGVNICRVADGIAKKLLGYQPLAETSNYDEVANPSTVNCTKCDSIEEQVELIMSRLETQLVTFPNELIGILCPKRDTMNAIWDILSKSKHSDKAFLLHGSSDDMFPPDKPIVISTFHSAKGLEFRALHLAACDELKSFGRNRALTFTAVTRAKTALSVYHCDDLHGYFDAALQLLKPEPLPPTIEEVFGGTK